MITPRFAVEMNIVSFQPGQDLVTQIIDLLIERHHRISNSFGRQTMGFLVFFGEIHKLPNVTYLGI